jgi:hypothetical protein
MPPDKFELALAKILPERLAGDAPFLSSRYETNAITCSVRRKGLQSASQDNNQTMCSSTNENYLTRPAEAITTAQHRLVASIDAALVQQVLDIPQRERNRTYIMTASLLISGLILNHLKGAGRVMP